MNFYCPEGSFGKSGIGPVPIPRNPAEHRLERGHSLFYGDRLHTCLLHDFHDLRNFVFFDLRYGFGSEFFQGWPDAIHLPEQALAIKLLFLEVQKVEAFKRNGRGVFLFGLAKRFPKKTWK